MTFEDTRIRQFAEDMTVILPLKNILPENFTIDGGYTLSKGPGFQDYNFTITAQDFVTDIARESWKLPLSGSKQSNTPVKVLASRGFSLGNTILEDYVAVFLETHLLLYQLRSFDLVTNTLDFIADKNL